MPLSPKRRRDTFTSSDIDRDLTAMKGDPLFIDQRDREFTAFVDNQFSRAFGQAPAQTDATGRMVRREPATRTLDIFQPRPRPGDTRLGGSVGRAPAATAPTTSSERNAACPTPEHFPLKSPANAPEPPARACSRASKASSARTACRSMA